MDTTQGVDPFAMMTNAQNMFFKVISVAGYIWLGIAILQLAMAIHQEDGSGKQKAIMSLIGAILCAGVGTVVMLVSGGQSS